MGFSGARHSHILLFPLCFWDSYYSILTLSSLHASLQQHAGTSLRLLYNSVLYASERIQDTLTQLEMVLTALFEKPDTLVRGAANG